MRSVVVVLPASMCAMMPMLRHRDNGTCLATSYLFLNSVSASRKPVVPCPQLPNCGIAELTSQNQNPDSIRQSGTSAIPQSSSPSVVREGFVGFRHAVDVFLFLDGRAAIVSGVEQFVHQLI